LTELIDNDLPVELHDVFQVMQVTRGTSLERQVGADLVDMDRYQESKIHRHNLAETVLYFLKGEANVVIGDDLVTVRAGDRVRIHHGVPHGVRTPASSCTFLSVQVPPILDDETGRLDLEPM
jgi:quercetin dioxygenase-like cupin family protein